MHHTNNLIAGDEQITAGRRMEGHGNDFAGHNGIDGGVTTAIDGRVQVNGATVGNGNDLTGTGKSDFRWRCEIMAGVLGGENATRQLATLVVDWKKGKWRYYKYKTSKPFF